MGKSPWDPPGVGCGLSCAEPAFAVLLRVQESGSSLCREGAHGLEPAALRKDGS